MKVMVKIRTFEREYIVSTKFRQSRKELLPMVFKETKKIINSLPDNIKFIVNGKQTDVAAIAIKQNYIEINLEYEVNGYTV